MERMGADGFPSKQVKPGNDKSTAGGVKPLIHANSL
jgi:hypothetical protein